ncbi:TBCC domain-containing protein 1 isoform X4 [Hydra vulgaris]|uniref:TBCC domain-containing protein 1 n=1 Tax=Hydra vulgaris TaxID=6087 RepID=A0ABM4CP42_HYDVU
MSEKKSENYIWVNAEPFDIGVLLIPPPSKLTHHNLRKLHVYAKSKGKAGYPNLTFPVWHHVACNKLSIDENLAWIYFHTCSVLTGPHGNESNIKNDHKDLCKEKRSVDLLKFILYLYIQHSNVISMKSAIVTGDEYPYRNRVQELEGRAAIGVKTIDENAQMSFVMVHISEIFELLVEPDINNAKDEFLKLEAVNSLSFLLGSSNNTPIGEIASQPREAEESGFEKISQTFNSKKLQSWIKSNLRLNPFGVLSCLSSGLKLNCRGFNSGNDSLNASINLSDDTIFNTASFMEINSCKDQHNKETDINGYFKFHQTNIVNKVISNTNYAPELYKRIICNQICKRTVARTGNYLAHASVNIHRCQYSHLYLLSHLRSVVIEKCHNSTIVLGSVATCVIVVACKNICLVAITKRLSIISSSNSSFHVCVPSEPVLIGRNENIKLAPYYTWYPQLEKDMKLVGLLPEPNYWNLPIVLSRKNDSNQNIWHEFPPEEFSKFVIPFTFEGTTKNCPVSIPRRYIEVLNEREKRIEQWHQLIRDSNLSKAQRIQLQSVVNERFQEWLKETGNITFLESLAPPQIR